MNCQYCSNEMIKGNTIFVNNEYWLDCTCSKCRCIFTFEKKKYKLIKYVMYVGKYRLACDILNSTFNLGIFDEQGMARYKDVYTSNTVPTITPQNALDKVKTILVFL